MDMIQAVRVYMVTCPYLDESGTVKVDYLSNEPVNYSIDPVPSTTVLEEDLAGNTINQYLFAFSSQEAYNDETLNNMQNSGFFEKLAEWLRTQSNAGILPNFGTGKTVTKIYASGLGFIVSSTEGTATYQIQCGIIYEQEA